MFTWDEICSDWILKNCEDYDQSECMNAFTIIEKNLGRKWLEEKYRSMKGPVAVIPIIELGTILSRLESNPKFYSIVEKLRINKELDLARLASFYTKQGLDVEIEPEVLVGDRIKVPDLKVTFDGTPVYFEAYNPSASRKLRSLHTYATTISQQVLDEMPHGINFKIYLIREPTKQEVDELVKICKSISFATEEEKQYRIEDLAVCMSSPRENYQTIDDGRYLADGVRRFFMVFGYIHGEGIQKACLVGMPFTDSRVDRILRKQYPQLSREECNVVALELTGTSADLEFWSEGLKRRLQGEINTRIGAVILTRSLTNSEEGRIMIDHKIIKHTNPRKPLPDKFYKMTEKGILV